MIAEALAHPRFAPTLGRRSCPPAQPVLTSAAPLEGQDWRGLFGQLVVAEPGPEGGQLDVFVEGRQMIGSIRELRIRDQLVGPLPRMFAERSVSHFRIPRPVTSGDTVDPWFPS